MKRIKKHHYILGIVGFLGVFGILLARELHLQSLHSTLYSFPVGQGDAHLLLSPSGKQILIDGGPNLSPLEYLGEHMPFFDRTIELAILTHPDRDHITALPETYERYHIEHILLTGVHHTTGRYHWLLENIINEKSKVTIATHGTRIDMEDGLVLNVLWPLEQLLGQDKHTNNNSIVVKAIFDPPPQSGSSGPRSILFTGDIGKKTERALLSSAADLSSDIMTVPHHGSKTSSSPDFIEAVSPTVAVVSAGKNNRYGHPHKEVVHRFESRGIDILRTGSGKIVIPIRPKDLPIRP